MADARVVSNYLVDIAKKNGDQLTPMQVLKLVYIAHGFSLGIVGKRLIPNRIEAWKFGPVIPDLYHAIKHWRDQEVGSISTEGLEPFKQGEKELVEEVYNHYRGFDGITLSNLTHRSGTPWAQVYTPHRSSIQIPNDLIEHHYKMLLAAA